MPHDGADEIPASRRRLRALAPARFPCPDRRRRRPSRAACPTPTSVRREAGERTRDRRGFARPAPAADRAATGSKSTASASRSRSRRPRLTARNRDLAAPLRRRRRNSTRCDAARAIRASAISRRSASRARPRAPRRGVPRRQPDACSVSATTASRASPYHPSDRRFLDPLLIDVFGRAACRRIGLADALAAFDEPLAAFPRCVDYQAVWTLKRAALRARATPPSRARARPGRAIRCSRITRASSRGRRGAAALRDLSRRSRTSGKGEDWRVGPSALRRAPSRQPSPRRPRSAPTMSTSRCSAQFLADRQLQRAAARAQRSGGLEMGLYRDLAVGAAPDGAESWSRARRTRDRSRASARRPILSRRRARSGTCRRPTRSPARARAGAGSPRSMAPTCATPACCASTTRWA